MRRFSELLEALIFSPRRTVKLAHLSGWLRTAPHPDRGWGLAGLTGDLSFAHVKAGVVRELASEVSSPELFALSYDFVGDLAETVALLWPASLEQNSTQAAEDLRLSAIITSLQDTPRASIKPLLAGYMDRLNVAERWALLKLATGGMRVGVSGRLARTALAQAFDKDIAEIEEIWPLISPPYDDLFDWLEGRAARPQADGRAVFRPMMLAHPVDEESMGEGFVPADWQVEWKWDGARIQLVSAEDGVRLFSRTGDDISASFPELITEMSWKGVLDGEVLAGTPEDVGSFNDLQQRLNRKRVTSHMQQDFPVFIRAYDILFAGDNDLRNLPLSQRRLKLEAEMTEIDAPKLDLSEHLPAADFESLQAMKEQADPRIEGIMLKKADSLYIAGRPKGCWFKLKRDPKHADLVVLYAQRGHGKRSSFYSDYTFGAWREGENGAELVPVCKAYSGFSDAELRQLDKFVRSHTINKFGPVREVEHKLVVEIAFDQLHKSKRHKSGIAMRFPRFHAIRWDKPAEEADNVAYLRSFIPDEDT
ncbi:MAG: cisplatin damage response ATP-dependent DNA ligase [Alphaproteobacteria bacterium]|nr:cisplatin damage response ATP-dependent DNA ligase [Alphaproteobacteria bacterium]MBL6776970.1 cisplatin damage response ATP-dependent DNA ligase [Alphaproteobacteria bacterium]